MYVYDESLLREQQEKVFKLKDKKEKLEERIRQEEAKYTQLKKLIRGSSF